MQNRALKTSENDGEFVCASFFMIALGCIFGPGHFRPVAPRSVRALYQQCPHWVQSVLFYSVRKEEVSRILHRKVQSPVLLYYRFTSHDISKGVC